MEGRSSLGGGAQGERAMRGSRSFEVQAWVGGGDLQAWLGLLGELEPAGAGWGRSHWV